MSAVRCRQCGRPIVWEDGWFHDGAMPDHDAEPPSDVDERARRAGYRDVQHWIEVYVARLAALTGRALRVNYAYGRPRVVEDVESETPDGPARGERDISPRLPEAEMIDWLLGVGAVHEHGLYPRKAAERPVAPLERRRS